MIDGFASSELLFEASSSAFSFMEPQITVFGQEGKE